MNFGILIKSITSIIILYIDGNTDCSVGPQYSTQGLHWMGSADGLYQVTMLP